MQSWKTLLKATLWLLLIAASYVGYSLYRHIKHTLPDCYAQWSAAEFVLIYRRDQGKMPSNWGNLKTVFDKGHPLHNVGLNFEDIESRILIDFPSLPKLELDYAQAKPPEVITTTSGTSAHWGGAEPNQLVNTEIRTGYNSLIPSRAPAEN